MNTNWAGDAKDAAVNRVTTDAAVVASQTAVQRAGAQIAEDGSRDIQAAKREALDAIAEAEADGFEVGEDLSVTDTREVDETDDRGADEGCTRARRGHPLVRRATYANR